MQVKTQVKSMNDRGPHLAATCNLVMGRSWLFFLNAKHANRPHPTSFYVFFEAQLPLSSLLYLQPTHLYVQLAQKKFLKSEMHSLPHYVVHYRHRDIVGWIKVFNEPCVVFHMGASPRDEYLFGTIGSFVGFRLLEYIIVHHQ